MGTNLDKISLLYLANRHCFVDGRGFNKTIRTHEYYPSLLSLTETLDYFKIENIPFMAEWNEIVDINDNVLLHLQNGDYVLSTKITDDDIQYINDKKKLIVERKSVFLDKWDRVALYIPQCNSESGITYFLRRYLNRIIWLICSIIILYLLSQIIVIKVLTAFWYITFVLKCIGCFISFLLLKHNFGMEGYMQKKVCNISEYFDCGAVLSSPAAKIGGVISMSDVGFVYFLGGVFLMFGELIFDFKNLFQANYIIAIMTVPYSLFSIYYQKYIVKKWCPFCLCVIFVFLLEFFVGVFYLLQLNIAISYLSIFNMLLFYMIMSILWYFVSRYIKSILDLLGVEYNYLTLKKNRKFFILLLNNEVSCVETFLTTNIVIGNIDAPIKITILLSLQCEPCKETFMEIYNIMKIKPESILLKIRFQLSESNNSFTNLIAALIFLYKEDKNSFLDKLNYWYSVLDYEEFKTKFDLNEKLCVTKELEKDITEYANWCYANKIIKTPTLYLNDKILPRFYTLTEAILLLDKI